MNNSVSLKKKIIAAMAAGAIAFVTLASGCGAFNKTPEASSESTTPVADNSGSEKGKKSVSTEWGAKTEHFQISTPIANFLFNSYYENRRDAYAYQGLDVTKSLKEQYYNEAEGTTWFDFFMNETKKYLSQVLVMCEAARDDGLELETEDLESVKTTTESIHSAAKAEGMSYEEYLVKQFGEGVTGEDIENYLQLTALANKYYNKVYNGFTYTEEDYEKCFEENKTSYQYADFLKFNFVFPTDAESSDDRGPTDGAAG